MLLRVDESWVAEELRTQTTAAYAAIADGHTVAYIGAMRPYLFDPPVLWLEPKDYSRAAIKLARTDLPELYRLLHTDELRAEVQDDIEVNHRFVKWLGFEKMHSAHGMSLYRRKL